MGFSLQCRILSRRVLAGCLEGRGGRIPAPAPPPPAQGGGSGYQGILHKNLWVILGYYRPVEEKKGIQNEIRMMTRGRILVKSMGAEKVPWPKSRLFSWKATLFQHIFHADTVQYVLFKLTYTKKRETVHIVFKFLSRGLEAVSAEYRLTPRPPAMGKQSTHFSLSLLGHNHILPLHAIYGHIMAFGVNPAMPHQLWPQHRVPSINYAKVNENLLWLQYHRIPSMQWSLWTPDEKTNEIKRRSPRVRWDEIVFLYFFEFINHYLPKNVS
jgi:hypothetical protein